MSGLGNIIGPGGGILGGWDAEQQRQNALKIQQLQLQEQQRNAQAMSALGKYLQGGAQPGAGVPQQAPPPGQQQAQPPTPVQPPMGQGGPPPGMPPQGMAPGGMPGAGGGGAPMRQPMPMTPPQGSAPGQQSGPMGGGGQPMQAPGGGGGGGAVAPQPAGGGMTLTQLATQIKAKNPDIDDATLFSAVTQMSGLLNQQGIQQLDMAAKYWQHEDRVAALQEKADAAQMRSDNQKLSIAERQAAAADANQTKMLIAKLVQQGQGERQQKALDAKEQQTKDVQDRVDARLQKVLTAKGVSAQAKQQMQGASDSYKELLAQRNSVDGEIQETRFELTNGVGDRQQAAAKLQQLQAQRTAVNNKIVGVWQGAKKLGLSLPSPSELLSGGTGGGSGASPASGASTAVTEGGTSPSGAGSKYTVGQVIEAGGKKYKVTGGDLSGDPDVELVP